MKWSQFIKQKTVLYVLSSPLILTHLPLGRGTGTLGCSCLPLWIRTVAHYKKNIYIFSNDLWNNAPCYLLQNCTTDTVCFRCSWTPAERDLTGDPPFQLPPGFWQGSGCKPRWPPERVQTWQAAWWETPPQTSTPGKPLRPNPRGPPSSRTAEAATTVQLWGHIIICKQDKPHDSQSAGHLN